MPLKPITVSQVNEYISRTLRTDPLLAHVRVKGEVSGVNYNRSGNVYFDLVDGHSKIRCFLPREYKEFLETAGFRVENGSALVVTGQVSVYVPYGTYSIRISDVEEEGVGELQIAFERLKKKLSAEGLFDPARKRALPAFPDKIGIVTSPTGAAVHDIMTNIRQRNTHVEVLLFPTAVQGEGAPEQIARAVETANREHPELDILIVGRGGGSAEDLSAFNTEIVARAVAASAIPVISAVGHEIDVSITDFAADVRAETPTKAGVIAVPDTRELADRVEKLRADMLRELKSRVDYAVLRTDAVRTGMLRDMHQRIENADARIEKSRIALELRNPARILASGYTITTDENGRVVSDARALSEGQHVTLRYRDGTCGADISDVRTDPPRGAADGR